MPIKVLELAKELKLSNAELVSQLQKLGYGKLTPLHDLDDPAAAKVRAALGGSAPAPVVDDGAPIVVPLNVSVKELGDRLGVGAAEVQKVLMAFGVLAGLNQRLAPDAVNKIAKKLGKTVINGEAEPTAKPTAPSPAAAPAATRTATTTATPTPAQKPQSATPQNATPRPQPQRQPVPNNGKTADLAPRPPVVAIMGHVDHGKTSLLDYIRKAKVASGEAGGITQHIGAYQIEYDSKRITFLDTPGHSAFSSMRRRGASVTDIIVIVVAADDSIMPQTEEAIKVALEAKVPIIVAVNKIDLPDANPDRVLTDMTRYELVPSAYGGDVETVNLSAKTGEGVDGLLDMILLVTEAVVDPKADPHAKMRGTVIEAKVDKGRGAVVTVLVQEGTLRTGDSIVAGTFSGKVRGMTDERGQKVVKAGPSSPVEIIGLTGVPDAGDKIEVVKDEKEAKALATLRADQFREKNLVGTSKMTLEQLYRQLRTGPVKELNLVIKADVQGSVQAIRDNVADLGNEEVRTRVIHAGVGPISDGDVLLASSDREADDKNCVIVGFNVGTAGNADKKAEQEHVTVKTFSIIYELIDFVKDAMLALLPPIFEEVTLGKVEVRQMFKLPGGKQIAGSYVLEGVVKRNGRARVYRGKELIHDGPIDTLRRFKEDAREVQSDYECGITMRDSNDILVGDILETYEMRQVKREL